MVTWNGRGNPIFIDIELKCVFMLDSFKQRSTINKCCTDVLMTGSDLCSRRKALQSFRFSESLVDLSPVLQFLLVCEEIQPAFSTAMDPFFLK